MAISVGWRLLLIGYGRVRMLIDILNGDYEYKLMLTRAFASNLHLKR